MRKPSSSATGSRRKRGRPRKFTQPSQVVALTLPDDVVSGLRQIHPDLAWAIVTMFEGRQSRRADVAPPEVELISVGDRRGLIVLNRRSYNRLPGVHFIPIDAARAFLALDPGRGLADLQIAVIDRLAVRSIRAREREALRNLQAHLQKWRRNRRLQFQTRTIIVAEPAGGGRTRWPPD